MHSDKIAYTFDWREDARGYSWAFVESCPIDGLNVRTGHSPSFLAMANSLLAIAWGSPQEIDKHNFYSLSPYPKKYASSSLNGYATVLGAERDDRKWCSFALSPIINNEGTPGVAYVLPVYLEHTYLEPMNLKGLAEALPPGDHRDFWSISIVKTVRSLLGEQVDPPNKITSSKAKVKKAAPQQIKSPAVKTDANGIPLPMKAMGCTKGQLRAQGREQWMGERIPKGVIVYATDGSSGINGGSYSYVTSLGNYYVASDKSIKDNSYKAELKAITIARDNAMRHVKEGKRVLILSDNINAVQQAKKMEIPKGIPSHLLEIRWVRGHSGHPLNQAADSIASIARKEGSEKDKKKRMDRIMNMQIIQWRKHLEQQVNAEAEKRAAMESYFSMDTSNTIGELWEKTPLTLGRIWACNVKAPVPTPRAIFA